MKCLLAMLAVMLLCSPSLAQQVNQDQAIKKANRDLIADTPFPRPQPDEHHEILVREAGTWDADSKSLTFHSTVRDESGNEMKQRQVTTFVDENTRKFEAFLVFEQRGQSVDVMLMEIVSKKRE